MRYLQRDVNGSYRFRRRMPADAKHVFSGRWEFLKVLGKAETEALAAYCAVHREFEQLLALARSAGSEGSELQRWQRNRELIKLTRPL